MIYKKLVLLSVLSLFLGISSAFGGMSWTTWMTLSLCGNGFPPVLYRVEYSDSAQSMVIEIIYWPQGYDVNNPPSNPTNYYIVENSNPKLYSNVKEFMDKVAQSIYNAASSSAANTDYYWFSIGYTNYNSTNYIRGMMPRPVKP